MRTFFVTRLVHHADYPQGPLDFDEVLYTVQAVTAPEACAIADESKHDVEHAHGWCRDRDRVRVHLGTGSARHGGR